ncbi:MAG TPA: CHAT domain-containing tetratricopeptide repeat protein [Xanthobacteraceae bacterium]|nr:CHAT domain-containing tetratricopeptide repeat protein [Xanthobacteraceae bacterium]
MSGSGKCNYIPHIVLAVFLGLADAAGIDVKLALSQTKEAQALNKQYLKLYEQGRYSEAIPLAQRVLAIVEKSLGPNHPDVGTLLYDIATLYYAQGRYAEAEALFKRSLAIGEKSFGPDNPRVASVLSNLAALYDRQGRYADAEPLNKRSLSVYEKSLGPNHPDVGQSLNNLATLYYHQGRYAEAEPLFKRSLAIREKSLGPNHPDVATSMTNLAELYSTQGRYAEAEPLHKRSLAIVEKSLGPNHPDVAESLNNLAGLYDDQGRSAEAEPLYRRSLAIWEKSLGPGHPSVATLLINLAGLYSAQGRYADAEPLLKRSLSIREKSLGPDHPNVGRSLNNLAGLYKDEGRYVDALPLVRAATERGYVNQAVHLSVLLGARRAKDLSEDKAIAESFDVVQRAASSAASAAVSQLAVRFAAGTDDLAQLVRKDQDLSAENERLDKDLIAAVSKSPNQRDSTQEAATRKRLAEIADARAEVGRVLAQRFPDYAALSKPQPLNVGDVSSLLTDDEALVLIDLGKGKGDASYIWVVDRSGAVWKTIDAKSEDLATKITVLRASLDPSSNKPFDVKLAYELYELILGPVENSIAKKSRLLMVMNGALTSLPPQVLVTSDPTGKDLKSTDWLIRRQAISILPSVYSLKVLRGEKAKVAAAKPLIGFGDPVFNRGGAEVGTRIASNRGYASFYRGATADLDVLAKALPPLPETADELRAVAKSLGADEADIKLGSAATEATVKQTKLDQYRIVYFATHALVSGETEQAAKGLAEPALVLSLPPKATALDDGLLTSSEVAQLKLNADWVILSACNTASGDKPGAEALSGLARAFFYAGARSLLVSHWPVDSEPAVKLMTAMFAAIAKNPKLTTAEALRQAMLATMSDRNNPEWANPTSWAPFVLVGDGGPITR